MTLDEQITEAAERLRRSTNKRAGYALRSMRHNIRKDCVRFELKLHGSLSKIRADLNPYRGLNDPRARALFQDAENRRWAKNLASMSVGRMNVEQLNVRVLDDREAA